MVSLYRSWTRKIPLYAMILFNHQLLGSILCNSPGSPLIRPKSRGYFLRLTAGSITEYGAITSSACKQVWRHTQCLFLIRHLTAFKMTYIPNRRCSARTKLVRLFIATPPSPSMEPGLKFPVHVEFVHDKEAPRRKATTPPLSRRHSESNPVLYLNLNTSLTRHLSPKTPVYSFPSERMTRTSK